MSMLHLWHRAMVVAFHLAVFPTLLAAFKARKPGGVVLGGLFLIHYSESAGSDCKALFPSGLGHAAAMAFAIDRINDDPRLLPSKKLGYDIRDYCASPAHAMREAYEFVREVDTHQPSSHNGSDVSDIVAMIGPFDSASSVLIGNLLDIVRIPAISYAATSDELSSPLYKNFFRTVPPDSQQAKAMADIIEHFKWNYVATVAMDDSYGRFGVSALERESINRDSFCLGFSEFVPRFDYSQKLKRIVTKIKQHPLTRVIVLWLFGGQAHAFLEEAERQRLHDRTWILSDGLACKEGITWASYSRVLQGALGIEPFYRPDVEFEKYLKSLTAKSVETSGNPWWREFWKEENDCSTSDENRGLKGCPADMRLSSSSIDKLAGFYLPYVTDAVYSVAHALHRMYNCTEPHGLLQNGSCRTSRHHIRPSDLNIYLRNVSFNGLTGKVQYDRFGDPVASSYQINNIFWDSRRSVVRSPVVGTWKDSILRINDTMIHWISDSGVPLSQCTETCQAGTFQARTTRCCWECETCPKLTVSVYAGAANCSECPSLKKPDENSSSCVDLPVANPSWDSATSILIIMFAGFGLLAACFTSAVFLKFRNTPVIRASNRELSVVLLVAIFMCFGLVIVDVARPNNFICRASVTWRMFPFAVIISVLLLKTMRILHHFKVNAVTQRFRNFVFKIRCQASLVCALVSVEIVSSTLWLLLDPPTAGVEEVRGEHMFYLCVPHVSYTGMAFKIVINSHIFLLSLVCTYYAYKSRGLPENFNEGRSIGFSMYILLISSLVYYPMELGVTAWYLPTMASAATILSSYGLLGCMFGPKIHLILREPERNTRNVVREELRQHVFRSTLNQTPTPAMLTSVAPVPLPTASGSQGNISVLTLA